MATVTEDREAITQSREATTQDKEATTQDREATAKFREATTLPTEATTQSREPTKQPSVATTQSNWTTTQPTEVTPECTFNENTGITDCSNMGLRTIPQINPASKRVLLQKNKIASINCYRFKFLGENVKLDMSDNQLTVVPANCFSGMSGRLHVLYLRFNQITYVHPTAFSGLSNLKILNLKDNQISKFLPAHLSEVPNLLSLNLINNEIGSLQQDTFQNVEKLNQLYLNRNPVGTLEPSLFSNLSKLTDLSLWGVLSEPGTLSESLFDDLVSLKLLSLRSNHLTSVTPQHLKNIPRNPSNPLILPLGLNPLQCCPHMLWLKEEEHNGSIIFQGGNSGSYRTDPECADGFDWSTLSRDACEGKWR